MSQRTLRLTSPPMRGDDVELFQEDCNRILKAWRVKHRLAEDGQMGPETARIGNAVCHGLAIARLARRGFTPDVRSLIRHAGTKHDGRTPAQRKVSRTKRRVYRSALRKRYSGGAVGSALSWAAKQVGTTESPAGSNRGPKVTPWLAAVGIPGGGAPWCGAFANQVRIRMGFGDDDRMRYCPYVEADAKAGRDGWRWVPASASPKKGWFVLYGVREAVHIGVVREDGVHGGLIRTIEGNTSAGASGSQDNGGGVFRRERPRGGGFPVRGYAVPPGL